jgi:peptidoglycan hydrolase-like protein with peptidoglycan-binding domain
MENFKFYAVTFLLIIGAAFLGYGAISSLRDPVYYVNDQTLATVGDLKSGTPVQTSTIPDTAEPTTPTPDPVVPTPEPTTPAPVETPTTAPSKNADLIARLNKISGTLKNGSKGDNVKAIQEALNIVAAAKLPTNGTFGDQTEAAVKKFQTSAKISPATGQVASKTIAALVAKLK